MADRFVGAVTIRGGNGRVSSVRYNLVDVTYAEAKTALDNIVAELDPLTNGTIVQRSLSFIYGEDDAAGAGDLFERATLAVHINADGTVDKFAVLNVPGPAQAIFEGTTGGARDIVDVDNADVQAYVAILATETTVSDGESINVGLGTAGIKSGRRTLANVKLG